MKKILFFALLVLFSGSMLAGCEGFGVSIDRPGYSYYVWKNASDHEITLSAISVRTYPEDPGSYVFNKTLQSGDSFEWEERGGIAHCPPPSQLTARNLMATFDGQVEVVYVRDYGGLNPPANYDQRYDISWESNYVQETVVPKNCKKCEGIRWTYTFTNADYEAAVAYSQAQEAQGGEAE